MERSCLAVVLAAGDGTRMRSQTPKVLHRVAGLPMVGHVVRAAGEAGVTGLAVVVGNQAEQVSKVLDSMGVPTQIFEQTERLGTGHAVLAARAAIEQGADDLLILFGDTPLVRPQVLIDARAKLASGADVVVVGFTTGDPSGYGRVLMGGGKVTAIREHKDATEAERKVQFCNGGLMAIRGDRALGWLDAISNDNAKGEFYLTDIVEIARSAGGTVDAVEAGEEDVLGVNNKLELARAEAIWQGRKRADMMLEGVSMIAPETVFFSHDTQIGAETIIEPNVVFGEGVTIANGVTIQAFCHIAGTQAEEGVVIGPFARLRPGARLGNGSKVGNFCEVKNAELGRDAKINHLTYIGDAEIGAGSNIGAGTITCNYDGFSKFRTRIGEGAFIGSNSSLVAPVSIGDGSYVASGSVITEDVADDALAFGRARQSNKDGMGKALKERLKSEKEKARKG